MVWRAPCSRTRRGRARRPRRGRLPPAGLVDVLDPARCRPSRPLAGIRPSSSSSSRRAERGSQPCGHRCVASYRSRPTVGENRVPMASQARHLAETGRRSRTQARRMAGKGCRWPPRRDRWRERCPRKPRLRLRPWLASSSARAALGRHEADQEAVAMLAHSDLDARLLGDLHQPLADGGGLVRLVEADLEDVVRPMEAADQPRELAMLTQPLTLEWRQLRTLGSGPGCVHERGVRLADLDHRCLSVQGARTG